MRVAFLGFLLLMIAGTAFAQESAGCKSWGDKASSQQELNVCAGEEAARADAKLNEVYRKLLLAAGRRSGTVQKIKIAQRAWIAYRDAYLAASFPAVNKQAEYGSMYPMESHLLSAKLTQRQTVALEELLKQYSDDE